MTNTNTPALEALIRAVRYADKMIKAGEPAKVKDFITESELREIAALQPASGEALTDEQISKVWLMAMTGATNIAIDEQNRTNEDDGSSEVMQAQGEIIRRLKEWLNIDPQTLKEIRQTIDYTVPQPAPDEKPVAWLSVTTGKGPYDKGHIQSVSLEKPDYPSAMFEALPLYTHPQPQSDVVKALEDALKTAQKALKKHHAWQSDDQVYGIKLGNEWIELNRSAEYADSSLCEVTEDAFVEIRKALRTAGGEHE